MTDMIQKQMDKIEKMDSVSLLEYKESIIKYSVPGEARTKILDACDEKLRRLNRDDALVVETDMSDFGTIE